MPQDISNLSFQTANSHHYSVDKFNKKIAPRIIGAENNSWEEEAKATALSSCAMRVSIALAYAGLTWRPRETNNVWRLDGTSVLFPSLASDYPEVPLLSGREEIQSSSQISGRRGVIFFGGNFAAGISGHVTLWNGGACHFQDQYWDQPKKYFWKMV